MGFFLPLHENRVNSILALHFISIIYLQLLKTVFYFIKKIDDETTTNLHVLMSPDFERVVFGNVLHYVYVCFCMHLYVKPSDH